MGGSSSCISLRLLGGFELRHAATPLEVCVPGRRLLALVALQPRPLARAVVAGTLWPETTDARAGSNLRTALWRLHNLPEPVMQVTPATVALAPAVEADTRFVEVAAGALASGDPRFDADSVDPALLAGELLPELWDDWLVFERERLRQLSLHALDLLAGRLSAAGRHSAAVGAALAAVRMEPQRETSNRVLVEAHLAEGNVCEAVRQYRLYADLIWRELRAVPTPSFEALVAAYTTPLTAGPARPVGDSLRRS
jgi:DNA-binding SARP family transcriptional activator